MQLISLAHFLGTFKSLLSRGASLVKEATTFLVIRMPLQWAVSANDGKMRLLFLFAQGLLCLAICIGFATVFCISTSVWLHVQ